MDESALRYMFDRIDGERKGKIDIESYKDIMSSKASIIPWFELLNYGMDGVIPKELKEEQALLLQKQTTLRADTLDKAKNLKGQIDSLKSLCSS